MDSSMDTLTAQLDAQARQWYPDMSESERAEYVARQVTIATGR
jgi:hypothetical protein